MVYDFYEKSTRKMARFLEYRFNLEKKNEMISLKIHYKILLFVITYNNH